MEGGLKFSEKMSISKDHVLYGPIYMTFLRLIIIKEEPVRVIGVSLASLLRGGYRHTSWGALW